MTKYGIFTARNAANAIYLDKLDGLAPATLFTGAPLAEVVTSPVTLTARSDTDETTLYDIVPNLFRLCIVSSPLQDYLQSNSLAEVEYLPITILRDDGNVLADDYWLVHPRSIVDCVDMDETYVEWSDEANHELFCFEDIVLRDDLDKQPAIFRMRYITYAVMLRKDVLDTARANFSNLNPVDLYDLIA